MYCRAFRNCNKSAFDGLFLLAAVYNLIIFPHILLPEIKYGILFVKTRVNRGLKSIALVSLEAATVI